MAKHISHHPSFFSHRSLAERLESRRLLASSLDALGILTVTGGAEDNIIQFQVADSPGGGPALTFDVLESTATGASPPLSFPTQQQVLDYISSGGTPGETTFNLADVREIRIVSGDGDDLIILGNKLPIPASIDAGGGNDSVSTGIRDDTVTGGSGNDYLFGHGGNDAIGGALGGDEILGGTGIDTGDFKTRSVDLNISIDNLIGDGQASENDNVRTDIEQIIGGTANDTIDASSAPGPVVLDGADGDDSLTGSAFEDVLIGGAGTDELDGGDGNDTVFVEDGEDDVVTGGGGLDIAFNDATETPDVELAIDGDPSEDPPLQAGGTAGLNSGVLTVNGGTGNDAIGVQLNQAGDALLVIEVPNYETADLDNDALVSSFVLDDVNSVVINLLAGNDVFHGANFAGPITINGGDGDDVMAGGAGDDSLNGENGNDWLFGRGGADTLNGAAGGDFQSGGPGDDTTTYAGEQEDVLVGIGQIPDDGERGEGDNVQLDVENVIGGNGNDRLNTQGSTAVRFVGGPGRDIITGGPGADEYSVLDAEIDTVRGGGGGDDVLDQDDDDDIDLDD